METAIIVRGRMADARHIELDEAVPEMAGTIEVVLRPLHQPPAPTVDVFELIASLGPGSRAKDEIDRQLRDEREAWGDR